MGRQSRLAATTDVGGVSDSSSALAISKDEQHVLSYYRTSEITGALFFGRIARTLRPSAIQVDLTKHFSDEAVHAHLWTDCLHRCGSEALRLGDSYQDQYLEAVGFPVNIMEILAITQVFEKRIIGQYNRHARVEGINPVIHETLERIMADEKWHISWVKGALETLEPKFGKVEIEAKIALYTAADREVYTRTIGEHEERLAFIFNG